MMDVLDEFSGLEDLNADVRAAEAALRAAVARRDAAALTFARFKIGDLVKPRTKRKICMVRGVSLRHTEILVRPGDLTYELAVPARRDGHYTFSYGWSADALQLVERREGWL